PTGTDPTTPLPKPPAKRADMLSAGDFSAQPKPARKKASASARPVATRPAAPALEPASSAPAKPPATPAAPPRPRRQHPQGQPGLASTAPATADKERRAPQVNIPVDVPVASRGAGSKVSAPASAGRGTRRSRTGTGPAKLFVLDTNVLLHDPMSLFRFQEHDVYLPMITLEELDGHKKGLTEVARNARQV